MKEVTVNKDGTKSIKRSVVVNVGVPTIRLIPDMGLGRGDTVEVTIKPNGNGEWRKLK